MYARLAFAVAAHVDASILVIDELLSVGDAGFAQKCFRFLEGFRQQGTVVFVSHDLGAVHRFCDRVIWLHRGRIHAQGPPKPVCDAYLGFMFQGGGEPKPVPQVRAPDPGTDRLGRPGAVVAQDPRHGQMDNPIRIGGFGAGASAFGEGGARVTDVALLGPDGGALDAVRGGETVTVRVTATAKTRLEAPILGFYLRDRTGQNLFGDNTYLTLLDKRLPLAPGQSVTALFTFQMPYLARGEYSLSVAIADGSELAHTQHHWIDDAVRITVPASHFAHGLVGIPMQDVSVSVDGDPVVGAA